VYNLAVTAARHDKGNKVAAHYAKYFCFGNSPTTLPLSLLSGYRTLGLNGCTSVLPPIDDRARRTHKKDKRGVPWNKNGCSELLN
jgi:hypothetical protein